MDYRGLFSGRNLRVGVFLSGQLREYEHLPAIVKEIKREFSFAKVIGCVWDTCEKKYGPQNKRLQIPIHTIPEPVIDYNPYWANEHVYENHPEWSRKISHCPPVEDKFSEHPDLENRHTHQTKMIIGHNHLVKQYYNDFDIMVRARWDVFIGENLSLMELCEEAYRLPAVVSLGCRIGFPVHKNERVKTFDSHNTTFGLPYLKRNMVLVQRQVTPMVTDYGLIFHRNVDWPVEFVEDLRKNKKLLPAEWGWWQTMIERKSIRYVHYDGGSGIYRTKMKYQWK